VTAKKRTKSMDLPVVMPEAADRNRQGLERLIFFNDGVFAIAITLLALEIRLPAGAAASNDAELLASLLDMLPKYLAYVVSFLVIGSFWFAHHRKFALIKRYDGRLLGLNLVILMVVAFIPFPSSVISENTSLTATIFYALSMSLIGFLYSVLWAYASWHYRLIDPSLSPQQVRRELLIPLFTSAIFLLSIGVALLDLGIARLIWLLILPTSLLVNKGEK
jgi:uncharacterized membrane protein